jgi:hemolysin III
VRELTGVRPHRALPRGEEIANSITHGAGLLASLAGLLVLVTTAAKHGDASQLLGFSVFGAMLVLLYTASTLYHALPASPAKRIFRVLDHAAIYLLIAGTYTPFMLGALRGAWGWTLLGTVWGLAAVGITLKASCGLRAPRWSTAVYIVMGWMVLVAFRPLVAHVAIAGILWLLAGGIFYTVGVVFFAWERLRYTHTVWHLFVLAGSSCHYVAVLWYSAPRLS